MTKKIVDRTRSTNVVLNQTNLRDSAKETVKKRLMECGWCDQVRMACRNYLNDPNTENSLNDMVNFVTPKARSLVPDVVKRELLHDLQAGLMDIAQLNL